MDFFIKKPSPFLDIAVSSMRPLIQIALNWEAWFVKKRKDQPILVLLL